MASYMYGRTDFGEIKNITGVKSLETYFVYTFTIEAEEPYFVRVKHILCLLYVTQ